MSELLPGVPSDGVNAVDALQDYRDTWHTYGYNDCRMLECTFLAEEGEISLASAGPGNEQFTVNLTNASDAVGGDKEETRRWLGAELTRILFPVFLEIYSVSAGPGVRHTAL